MKTEKRAVVIKLGFNSYIVAIYHITDTWPDSGSKMASGTIDNRFYTPVQAKSFINTHFPEVVEIVYKDIAEILDDLSPWNYFEF